MSYITVLVNDYFFNSAAESKLTDVVILDIFITLFPNLLAYSHSSSMHSLSLLLTKKMEKAYYYSPSLTLVPSAGPVGVEVGEVTSSSITVQWGEVPCIHQNGVITGYSVKYEVMGSGDTPQTMAVDGASVNETTIDNLMSSTTYSVQVAAVNSEGTGVYSDPITATTEGVHYIKVINSVNIVLYNRGAVDIGSH